MSNVCAAAGGTFRKIPPAADVSRGRKTPLAAVFFGQPLLLTPPFSASFSTFAAGFFYLPPPAFLGEPPRLCGQNIFAPEALCNPPPPAFLGEPPCHFASKKSAPEAPTPRPRQPVQRAKKFLRLEAPTPRLSRQTYFYRPEALKRPAASRQAAPLRAKSLRPKHRRRARDAGAFFCKQKNSASACPCKDAASIEAPTGSCPPLPTNLKRQGRNASFAFLPLPFGLDFPPALRVNQGGVPKDAAYLSLAFNAFRIFQKVFRG